MIILRGSLRHAVAVEHFGRLAEHDAIDKPDLLAVALFHTKWLCTDHGTAPRRSRHGLTITLQVTLQVTLHGGVIAL